MRKAKKWEETFGLTADVLHEIRKAQRALKRAQTWIEREHRQMKKRKKLLSNEWLESKRIRDEERTRHALQTASEQAQERQQLPPIDQPYEKD